jgi:hypothetical protein
MSSCVGINVCIMTINLCICAYTVFYSLENSGEFCVNGKNCALRSLAADCPIFQRYYHWVRSLPEFLAMNFFDRSGIWKLSGVSRNLNVSQ